jgi:hypothetical protein
MAEGSKFPKFEYSGARTAPSWPPSAPGALRGSHTGGRQGGLPRPARGARSSAERGPWRRSGETGAGRLAAPPALAERGGEAERQCVVGSCGVRARLGVRSGGALREGIRKPASRLGLDPIACAQAIARSEVLGAVSHDGVEGEPVRFRVSGVARYRCTARTHPATWSMLPHIYPPA